MGSLLQHEMLADVACGSWLCENPLTGCPGARLGDHYDGEFVKEPFRRHGISYEVCKQPKSDLFRDMLPLLNAGHITLPRHDRLIAQIVGLESQAGAVCGKMCHSAVLDRPQIAQDCAQRLLFGLNKSHQSLIVNAKIDSIRDSA